MPRRALPSHQAIPIALILGNTLLLLVLYRPLSGLLRIAESARPSSRDVENILFSPTLTSPDMIFGLFALLVLGRFTRLRRTMKNSPASWTALGLFVAAATLNLWSAHTNVAMLMIPSLSLMVLAIGCWLGGRRGFAALLMPALFLLLAYPIPAPLLNAWLFPQQLLVATGTAQMLSGVNIPALAQGDLILTSKGVFQVIESCAGIRMVMTFLMTALVYTEIFYRGRLQSAIVILVAPLLGLAVNQLRVISITLAPESGVGDMHTIQGIVMLVVGVLLLHGFNLLLCRIMAPGRPEDAPTYAAPALEKPNPPLLTLRLTLMLGLALLLAAADFLVPRWQESYPDLPSMRQFARMARQLESTAIRVDTDYLGSVHFDSYMSRRYENEGSPVALFIGTNNRMDPRVSIVSDKIAAFAPGFQIIEHEDVAIPFDSIGTAKSFVVKRGKAKDLVYLWYHNVDSLPMETVKTILGLDRSFLRDRYPLTRATAVRLATPIANETGGRKSGHKKIVGFLGKIEPHLEKVGAI